MHCQRCDSDRVIQLSAKCSDLFSATHHNYDASHEGYVPGDLGIGGDDYVEFRHCLNCGQIQGDFPLPKSKLEEDFIVPTYGVDNKIKELRKLLEDAYDFIRFNRPKELRTRNSTHVIHFETKLNEALTAARSADINYVKSEDE